MNASKLLLGILGGVAVGAIAGVLMAPDKGSKTRKKIMKKSRDLADDMKEKFEELYENATDKYEDLLQDAKGLVSNNNVK